MCGINTQVEKLRAELAASLQRSSAMSSLQTENQELLARLAALEGENRGLVRSLKCSDDEVTSYKKLTESLKQKIRELSSASGDGRDFLDSFEEVMRDEMMTMKDAFEAKLRAAREEADAATRRHNMQIQQLNSSSHTRPVPSTSTSTMNATATSTSSGSSYSSKPTTRSYNAFGY